MTNYDKLVDALIKHPDKITVEAAEALIAETGLSHLLNRLACEDFRDIEGAMEILKVLSRPYQHKERKL